MSNKNACEVPIIRTEYYENTHKNITGENIKDEINNKEHRKLTRCKMMKTLDIPEFDPPVAGIKTPNVTDNPLEAEEAIEHSPKQSRRRGLASHSFRVNWQILSSSFNSDALERYLIKKC